MTLWVLGLHCITTEAADSTQDGRAGIPPHLQVSTAISSIRIQKSGLSIYAVFGHHRLPPVTFSFSTGHFRSPGTRGFLCEGCLQLSYTCLKLSLNGCCVLSSKSVALNLLLQIFYTFSFLSVSCKLINSLLLLTFEGLGFRSQACKFCLSFCSKVG